MEGLSKNVPAQFFDVYLPMFSAKQLKICSSFKNKFSCRVSNKAVIEVLGANKKYGVELVKEKGEFYFRKGWEEFVQDNDVKIGEFFVFQYHGSSNFSVEIYDTDGCEKANTAAHIYPGVDLEIARSMVDYMKAQRETGRRGRPPMISRSNGQADHAAREFMNTLKNPAFKVTITKNFVSYIHLPSAFMKVYMDKGAAQSVNLIAEGTLSNVRVCTYSKIDLIYYKLGDGISDFAKKHRVRKGTVCVFEATNHRCDTVNVYIWRSE